MNIQANKARQLREMHVPGDPVILYNIWDAGSARAVARGGARAIATGSWSVAAAMGLASDGEAIALDDVMAIARRIVQSVDLPVTVDFEGGYALDPAGIDRNVRRLLGTGAVGLNIEDQVIGGTGMHPLDVQVARVGAVRAAADAMGIPAVINARTDMFLQAGPDGDHAALMADAMARGAAYAKVGADSFFVPGLLDPALIRQICQQVALPVNIMASDPAEAAALAGLGVGRISFGPAPYRAAMARLEAEARSLA